MKKLSYLVVSLSFAAIMMFSSCKKPNNIVTPTSGETVTNSFTASIGDGSKTYLDGLVVYWSEGDYICVNGSENQNKYMFRPKYQEEESGQPIYIPSTDGKFVNSILPNEYVADHYFAAYQGSNYMIQTATHEEIFFPDFNGSGENMKAYFFIPQDQSNSCRGIPNATTGEESIAFMNQEARILPMAAYSKTKTLQFHNLVNIVKLDLSAVASSKDGEPVIVNNVTISSSENLWGKFSVGTNLVPSATELIATQGQGGQGGQGGQEPPVLDPTPEIYARNLGIQIAPNQSKYLYFIIPVSSVANNTLHIKVEDGYGNAYIKDQQLVDNNAPNQLHKIKLDVAFARAPYVFSVAKNGETTTKAVQFYKTNLCCECQNNPSGPFGYDAKFGPVSKDMYSGYDQTYYKTSFSTGMIDHLMWTNDVDKAHMGCAPTAAVGDIIFTNTTATTPNPDFEVRNPSNNYETFIKGVWRSLSADELIYMLGTNTNYIPGGQYASYYGRAQARSLCCRAIIKGVKGFMILPDNYDGGYEMEQQYQKYSIEQLALGGPFGTTYKEFDANDWQYLENHGAVFMPSSGESLCTHLNAGNPDNETYYEFYNCGSCGALYLSDGIELETTGYGYEQTTISKANCFYWDDNGIELPKKCDTKYGRTIRLVKDY